MTKRSKAGREIAACSNVSMMTVGGYYGGDKASTIERVTSSRIEPEDTRFGLGRWASPSSLMHGDYVGSTVEMSNFEVFCVRFARTRDRVWRTMSYGYGAQGVLIDTWSKSKTLKDMAEFLGALEDYPLADEEHHTILEHHLSQEAWERSFRGALKEAISTRLPDGLDELFDEVCGNEFLDRVLDYENDRVQWVFETCDAYIDVDMLANGEVVSDLLNGLSRGLTGQAVQEAVSNAFDGEQWCSVDAEKRRQWDLVAEDLNHV